MVRPKFALMTLLAGCLVGQPLIAQAGCGCSKLPPELAAVRPNVTFTGQDVTLFHAALQAGQSYTVTFTSGMTGASATVEADAVVRRDFADSTEKPQLVVPLPALPLGPTSIRLADETGTLTTLADDILTVAPPPLVLSAQEGKYNYNNYQAAVSRAGVVYISLELDKVTHPLVITAQMKGYPLRFGSQDVTIYNTQGFLMQLLDEDIPGLFVIDATDKARDSDLLQYARHEFDTYFVQHVERQAHDVDATDPNWHLDGTPHIDHDHLILALSGELEDGSLPVPGATSAFKLTVQTGTLFNYGVVGLADLQLKDETTVAGNVLSNGPVTLTTKALVQGTATGTAVDIQDQARVQGCTTVTTTPTEFLPVYLPTEVANEGRLTIRKDKTHTLVGPGTYRFTELKVFSDGQLLIDNTDGPVTVYVSGPVTLAGTVTMLAPSPSDFALYVDGPTGVTLANQAPFTGMVYAPEAVLNIIGATDFIGAFVGQTTTVAGNAAIVHAD